MGIVYVSFDAETHTLCGFLGVFSLLTLPLILVQGGSVSAGMAIYDTMQYVPCDVSTVW